MQQRAVALRDLQAAKKYGTITRARDGARGDKRWKIEYGGVVYITDEQQKFVITTYQMNARGPTPLWTPPVYVPQLYYDPRPPLLWPVPLMLTPVAPPLPEGPAPPQLPVAVSVSTSASSATVSVSVAP